MERFIVNLVEKNPVILNNITNKIQKKHDKLNLLS